MQEFKIINVKSKFENQRIDHYLTTEFSNFSRSKIQKLVNDKKIYINNKLITKTGHKISTNDVIKIQFNLEKITDKSTEIKTNNLENFFNNLNIEILFEDDDLLIINKPNDLLVYGTKFNENKTLANYLKWKYPNRNFTNQDRYGIIHRLDRKTTGLMLIAKNENSFQKLTTLFIRKQITKKYMCIVHNCFNDINQKIKIQNKIGRSFQNVYKMQVNIGKDLKEAVTIFNVIKNLSNTHALVECNLITGRTHQIRVHMKYINHPIINDSLYGIEKEFSNYGQYLYCSNIKFIHPTTNKEININLDLPIEFKEKIKEIENE